MVASEKQRELKALTIVQPPVLEEVWDFYDDSVVDEVMVADLRSGVANALGCPQENVEVVATIDDDGNLRVNYVSVFLDYSQAKNIASSGASVVDISGG